MEFYVIGEKKGGMERYIVGDRRTHRAVRCRGRRTVSAYEEMMHGISCGQGEEGRMELYVVGEKKSRIAWRVFAEVSD